MSCNGPADLVNPTVALSCVNDVYARRIVPMAATLANIIGACSGEVAVHVGSTVVAIVGRVQCARQTTTRTGKVLHIANIMLHDEDRKFVPMTLFEGKAISWASATNFDVELHDIHTSAGSLPLRAGDVIELTRVIASEFRGVVGIKPTYNCLCRVLGRAGKLVSPQQNAAPAVGNDITAAVLARSHALIKLANDAFSHLWVAEEANVRLHLTTGEAHSGVDVADSRASEAVAPRTGGTECRRLRCVRSADELLHVADAATDSPMCNVRGGVLALQSVQDASSIRLRGSRINGGLKACPLVGVAVLLLSDSPLIPVMLYVRRYAVTASHPSQGSHGAAALMARLGEASRATAPRRLYEGISAALGTSGTTLRGDVIVTHVRLVWSKEDECRVLETTVNTSVIDAAVEVVTVGCKAAAANRKRLRYDGVSYEICNTTGADAAHDTNNGDLLFHGLNFNKGSSGHLFAAEMSTGLASLTQAELLLGLVDNQAQHCASTNGLPFAPRMMRVHARVMAMLWPDAGLRVGDLAQFTENQVACGEAIECIEVDAIPSSRMGTKLAMTQQSSHHTELWGIYGTPTSTYYTTAGKLAAKQVGFTTAQPIEPPHIASLIHVVCSICGVELLPDERSITRCVDCAIENRDACAVWAYRTAWVQLQLLGGQGRLCWVMLRDDELLEKLPFAGISATYVAERLHQRRVNTTVHEGNSSALNDGNGMLPVDGVLVEALTAFCSGKATESRPLALLLELELCRDMADRAYFLVSAGEVESSGER